MPMHMAWLFGLLFFSLATNWIGLLAWQYNVVGLPGGFYFQSFTAHLALLFILIKTMIN